MTLKRISGKDINEFETIMREEGYNIWSVAGVDGIERFLLAILEAHKAVIKEMEAKNKFICDELIGETRSLGHTVDYLKGELDTLKQKYGGE